jgi:hypothetical protein
MLLIRILDLRASTNATFCDKFMIYTSNITAAIELRRDEEIIHVDRGSLVDTFMFIPTFLT